ncbi:MAG: hypothetical protein QY310_08610 [Candidatus Jettenia sp. CY-1]|nr:hypothetical protein [Candidatus Jettenia sp.]WKZ17497.1 MAG: hypothetical protein QY310_08610 [Candidatus Jettenia sp. CY-1]
MLEIGISHNAISFPVENREGIKDEIKRMIDCNEIDAISAEAKSLYKIGIDKLSILPLSILIPETENFVLMS